MKGKPQKKAEPAERVIKRYDNRKLYDPEARAYVTLADLARTLAKGIEIRVVDQKSGDDMTTVVLAQIILEGIKEKTATIPRQVLARLVRLGLGPSSAWGQLLGPPAASRAKAEAERIVASLLARGRLTLDEGLALRQEIAGTVHRLVSEAQHGIESRLRSLLERSEKETGVSPSLQTLKERLLSFENYLGEPAPAGPKSMPTAATSNDRRGRR